MWNAAFAHHGINSEYITFDVPSDRLREVLNLLLTHDKFKGFNITNPYKEPTAEHPSIQVDNLARIVGGVNTVHKIGSEIQGHSTDGYGAIKSIEEECGKGVVSKSNILILGAGGSGSAIAVACADEGGNVQIANRTIGRAMDLAERAKQYGRNIAPLKLYSENGGYSNEFLEALAEADILINTLPIEKNTGKPLFGNHELVCDGKACMDIVYGHQSQFLKTAREEGHYTIDGGWMLLHQAARAFEYVYQNEVILKELSTEAITAPMRYALENCTFAEATGSVVRKVERARKEISDKII